MEKRMFLLMVIFLVPRNTFAENKTGTLFDELDNLLANNTVEHMTFYTSKRECLRGLDFIEENYRSEHYGLDLLLKILKRYNYLTHLYNSGCDKQENGDPTCGPFGCHKVDISFLQGQEQDQEQDEEQGQEQDQDQDQVQAQNGDYIARRSITFKTSINSTNNNMNIWLATASPIYLPHKLTTPPPTTTANPTTTPHQSTTPPKSTEPSRVDRHCSEKDRKWLPLPFDPWGYCSKNQPVGAPPDRGEKTSQ